MNIGALVENNMNTPKVLITGGTGFVGSHLVEALLSQNYSQDRSQIYVTSYSAANESFVASLLPADNIHQLDLTDQKATFSLIKTLKPDQIFHLASLAAVGKSYENIKKVIDNNTQLQLNLLEAVKQFSPHTRILTIGSAMEYDLSHDYPGFNPEQTVEEYPLGPASPYGVSKTTQDLLAYAYQQSFGLNIIRVRPFNHIGERQTPDFAIPAFAQQIAAVENNKQESIRVGNLTAIRDFTDVKDMVQAYILLMKKGKSGNVYNVGSGQGYTMQKVLEMMLELSTAEIRIEKDPTRIRPADITAAVADYSKIAQLGWQPRIELKDTLQRIINYWRSNS